MLLIRLPGAYHELDHAAKTAAGRNELGGVLATADSLALNDDFVRAAFADVPRNARYAVVLPKDEAAVESADGVSPITFDGVTPMFGNYLLPRRELKTPVRGAYIVCFYCGATAWRARVRWLSAVDGGGRVGYVER